MRVPPYFLAVQAQRWHRLCALCHEPVYSYVCHASKDDRAKLGRFKLFKSMANTHLLCDTCHQLMTWRLPPVRLKALTGVSGNPSFFHLYFATYYQYPTNQALNQFKDHESLSALMILIHALRQLPKPVGCHAKNTAIVPMPTTDKRLVKRGFYPVMVLAKWLAHHWGLSIWQGLGRITDSNRQRGLNRQARLDNIQDAFVLNDAPPVRQLILFDDVATTGTTIQAAAGTIMRHSPDTRIIAVCVAHGTAQMSLLQTKEG
ncbi:hypothetical protein AAX09_02405 [Moraxella bovoculi]|nr:hypothetical protein AAX09_02405 [Moraxella bovoculi]